MLFRSTVAVGAAPAAERASHPFYGIILASCERGDIRQSVEGLRVYTPHERREVPVARAALEREAELDYLYDAWAQDRPLAAHDGRWGQATLEVCLGILQSARERREIMMSRQTPYG